MWHVLVPMIATSVPHAVTVEAGAETWASTFATATAIPGRSPVQPAACSVSRPATSPKRTIERDIFSSTTWAKAGSRAAKNSVLGKPSSADQIALYPAVQLLRVSTPVSCQITQSAASIKRSAAR